MNDTDLVAHSCYSGFKDIAVQYMEAPETSKSVTQTFINIGYNFGEIYDDLEAFYFFLVQTPYYNGAGPEQGGAFLGNVVWWATSAPVAINNST